MKTLYFGGPILTLSDPLYVQAILVEDGKILASGSLDQLETMAADQRVDLKGSALLPGFIDPHSHFSQMASACLQVSLDGASSVEEIAGRIGRFLSETSPAPGSWVAARDYDNNRMPGLTNPTLAQLDAMAPGHPLVIHHKSGHMGLMNSAALSALGITPETPVPSGGKIEVKGGCLTGYLEENAFFTYLKQLPPTPPDQLLTAYAKAQEQYAAHGITTIQDGMVVEEMFPMYQMLLDAGILKLDLVVYPSPQAYDAAIERFGRLSPECHFRIGGMKVYLDGSPQGRTAWMRKPYAGEPDYRGYGTMEDSALEEAMEMACLRHTQLLCHCNGDGAAEQFLRCLARVEQKHPEMAQLRPVIIHGQLLAPDQLPRVKELGAVVSFFVAHVYHWGDVHLHNFGPERANRISPAHSALTLGIPFTFHQDAPVIQPDMLETLWCAVNRRTQAGIHLGPEEEISVLDALRAVTTSAAFQYFREQEIGALVPGMSADFVVLDRDPLTVSKEDLREIQVMAACKGGNWVYTKHPL
ncbi:MAG: amidohydrolase [Oscillospiraceae bacterium]|jgi:predicted amidohydrolase YtcJ|nr:amidohydrolase [Oscillospiraceae bacterium]